MCLQGLAETEALLKGRDKQRIALESVLGRSKKIGRLDGSISSDDEEYETCVGLVGCSTVTGVGAVGDGVGMRGGGVSTKLNELQSKARLKKLVSQAKSINTIDEAIYTYMLQMFEVTVLLLQPHIDDATDRVVILFTKLFKLQVKITSVLATLKLVSLPPKYMELAIFVTKTVQPKLEIFLINVSDRDRKD